MVPSGSTDADALNPHVIAAHEVVKLGLGGTFGPSTETWWETVPVPPRSSVTVRVMLGLLVAAYVCDAVDPVAEVPSPKSQPHPTTVPSESDDAVPSTEHTNPLQLDENTATGATFDASERVCCVFAVRPSLSVAVSTTTKLPAVDDACDARAPAPVR